MVAVLAELILSSRITNVLMMMYLPFLGFAILAILCGLLPCSRQTKINARVPTLGSNKDLDPSILGADDSDDNNRSSSEYQTCIVSNFYISDMIVAGLPIEGNSIYDDIT
ncbi:hypothetical protein LOK49_LG06G01844 [Camellia lanceoleosa]|uniref:Uncharacterized protein n=1 Tax=Camellia lanceoleosa TaxID=1840588 RepID=A0ACC0HFX9_9ERIC|nr:hypothetical protein LOK49_LG06G01844 [Camellia lanceoleosa]